MHPPPAARRFAHRSLPTTAVLPHATPPPRRSQLLPLPTRRIGVFSALRRLRSFPLATTAQTMGPDPCHLPYATPALQIDEHSALAGDKVLTSHTIPLRNAWTPPPSNCARHQ
ncbi:hypothetical protein C8J57DRAFT_1517338 [Mycena rebaudengoi]|nr:hypothetical protein C8J57DRAFT_1517338 [Mycena rebaudengoi]